MLLILRTIRNTFLRGKIQTFCVLKQVTIVIFRDTKRTEVYRIKFRIYVESRKKRTFYTK
jgi:hypothetical protein